jgi:serine phosphatase RsbU (regulator of sigma subunit)
MPAREVAGDFYDVFELPDGNIGLVIADVCDKGVGAALFMTLFRSLIRITANQDTFEPAENEQDSFFTEERLQRALTLTNNYIAETHQDSGMFATLFFGILEPRSGRLMYINGGHEPPLIVHSGNVRESLGKTGPAVGAIAGRRFEVQLVQLQPGEMFFSFTDGAPEAKDPRGEFFGRERLLHILQRCNSSAHDLVRTVEAELHLYMDGATQFDDIALLVVRRSP